MEPLGRSPIAPPLLVLGKAALACCWLFPLAGRFGIVTAPQESLPVLAAGAVLYVAGTLMGILSFASLGKSLSVGLPESATELKTGGVYRFSRNPIYVAAYALCAGSCLILPHPVNLSLFIVTVAIHHRIILSEEKFLRARFGKPYMEYQSRVRRYLGIFRKAQ